MPATAAKPLTRRIGWPAMTPCSRLHEGLRVVERRQADVKAGEVVVLVVAAVVVVGGARIQIVLGGSAQAQQDRGRHGGGIRPHHAHAWPQLLAHPRLDLGPIFLRQQIRLVDHHQVGGGELLLEQLLQRGLVVEGLIRGALGRQRVRVGREQAVAHRGAIDHRHHPVDRDPGGDLRPVEGFQQRLGQGQARGLDHDGIGRRRKRQQLLHGRHEIVRHRAADAAVGQLDDAVLVAGRIATAEQHLAIDADIAELVDDQGDPPAFAVLQQVADQAGLAGAEKAREHRGRDLCRHGGSWGYLRRCARPAVIKTTASACSAIP